MDKKTLSFIIILLSILGLFCFFRFDNLPQRTIFNWDQERDAYAVKQILGGNLTLIGPRVFGPRGFYLPPYFFYLLVPFYAVTKLSPYAIITFLIGYNIIFFLLSFCVLSKLFGNKFSVVFLLIWSINKLTISMDTIAWNPLMIPLLFILLIYFLSEYSKRKNNKRLFVLGFIFGLGISFHVQFFLLMPLLIPFVFHNGKIYKKGLVKKLIVFALAIITPFVPLVIFDFRHHFLNLHLLFDFTTESANNGLFSFIPVWTNIVSLFSGVSFNILLSVIFYFLVLTLLYKTYSNVKGYSINFRHKFWLGMLMTWLVFPVVFMIYSSRPSEYYFNFLIPIVVITIAFWVNYIFQVLERNQSGLFLLLLFLFFSVLTVRSLSVMQTNAHSLYAKNRLIRFLSGITRDSTPVNISFSVPVGEDSGFRYLIDYYSISQSKDTRDPLIQITTPPNENSVFSVGDYGLIVPDSWLKNNWNFK